MAARIVIIDDDPLMLQALELVFSGLDYDVRLFEEPLSALAYLKERQADIVITDMKMPHMNGIEVLQKIKELQNGAEVIVITAFGAVDSAVAAMKLGAADYITKPFSTDELEMVVKKTLEVKALKRENETLKTAVSRQMDAKRFVFQDDIMAGIVETVGKIAKTNATVLLTGETGTGKEMVAQLLHTESLRAGAPFIKVNCAALSSSLLESEMFGHEKGAFTGAIARRIGRFEMADKGSILLDEISEMDVGLQAKLLRVLQEREFERVGGSETIKVDVRVIATTNRDLLQEVEEGRFRGDLFYRLNVITIELPPLRQRKDDIPALAAYFVERYAKQVGKPILGISEDAMECLLGYEWPGNIRELENTIHRAVVLCDKEEIGVCDITFPIGGRYSAGRSHRLKKNRPTGVIIGRDG